MKQYENRFVAFIDILGFKNIISSTINDIELQTHIYSIMNYNAKIQERNYGDTFENMNRFGVEVTVFSDSIVISYPETFAGSLFCLLMDCVFVCNDLLNQGIFIRGGITYGQLIHEKTICFGPAMIDAYKLESEEAIFPRIIIKDSTIKQGIIHHGSANTPVMEAEYLHNLILKDFDGKNYLNFLSQYQEFDEGMYIPFLYQVRQYIIRNLHQSSGRIADKYIWFKNYYNNVVKMYDNDLIID